MNDKKSSVNKKKVKEIEKKVIQFLKENVDIAIMSLPSRIEENGDFVLKNSNNVMMALASEEFCYAIENLSKSNKVQIVPCSVLIPLSDGPQLGIMNCRMADPRRAVKGPAYKQETWMPAMVKLPK